MIVDESVPLASVNSSEVVEIEEDVVPLASVPQTGVHQGAAVASVGLFSALIMLLTRKKK